MCGIAGIFAYRDTAPPVSQPELLRMRDRMAARGPDGAGLWVSPDGRVGLAHRRLAILDLSDAGAQPMHDPETGNLIVFNGEIYNYRDLKQQLAREGVQFLTESDTEVLLHLYARYGDKMLDRIRGMFAFAIWDARHRRLFCARDPLGIKPLYYADDGKTLRFASQVKALIAGGAVGDAPSAAGMAGFFLWGHVPEPWTWAAAIRALPAGASMTVPIGGSAVAPRRYFDLREEILAAQDAPLMDADAVAEALDAVQDSVRQHLVADVPVGAFLSAGRDSTLIATLAARRLGEALRTVTLGFDEYRDTSLDEVPVAEAVAQRLGSRHTTVRVRRDDFAADRARILAAMDQPSIDGVNAWLVSRAAARAGLKLALSGLGGDELFGGYPSFVQVPRLARRLRFLAAMPFMGRALRIATVPLVARLTNPKWAGVFEYGHSLEGAWLLRRALFMPWELPQVMDPDMAQVGLRELAPLEDLHARIAGIRSPQLAVMMLEMSGYMRNQLLRDADWAGMAHSLEIRVPLVDRDLLRRWLRVAVHRFPLDRQRLLEAADPSIAHTVGSRPKSGFSVPVAQWLQKPGKRDSGANRGLRSWAKVVYSRFKDDTSHMRARSCRMTKCDSAMRILIYRFGQLGDTLIALPALKAIRQQFPAAKIVLLTSYSSRHSWVSIQEVLPQGLIDDFITYDISGSLLTTWTSLWLNFRREAFDLLVYLVPRTRSHFAIVRDLCFFRVCGIKHFVGHRGFDALPKRRDGVPLPAVQHEAEHLLGRLQRDGIALDRPVAAGLTLELTEKERIDGLIWLTKNLGLKSGRPVVGFGPGSKWQSKRWPEDRFAKLGRLLVDELNVFPIIFGGAEDKDLAARLLQHWGDGATAAGELTVRQAAAVLKQCDLYVGNDTGTMHLAVAVGTRCVAIFSAQDWPGRWYPYGTEHTVLRTAPSCEGCKLEVCIDRDIACLRAITVEQVFDAVRRALNDLNSSKRE